MNNGNGVSVVTDAVENVKETATNVGETIAHASGVDLLTGARIERGQALTIAPRDVIVLRED